MTRPDVWLPYGGLPRRPAEQRRPHIKIDPLSFLGTIVIANVLLLGGITGKLPWLICACEILTKKQTFEEKVQPHHTWKITTSMKWYDAATQVGPTDAGGCGLLQRARRAQYAWGRLSIIEKSNGLGRVIIDLSAFSKACARPTLINLPFIPELFHRIGCLRGTEGYMWSADLKNFFYQIPIKDFLASYFTVSFPGESFQYTTLPQGWSWAPVLAVSIAYGIMLGEWPEKLSALIDFSNIKGDTPPSFIPLTKGGVEIGLIVIWIDNIFVIATNKDIVESIRSHFMRRAKFCGAHFKIPTDKNGNALFIDHEGNAEPERVETSAVFLGAAFRWETDRFVWSHHSLDPYNKEVPLKAPRRDFSSIVGSLMWDATIAMEGTSCLQEDLDVIRRITKGVTQVRQWAEVVEITQSEHLTLTASLNRAMNRGDISVKDRFKTRAFVFAASDASSIKVGYVILGRERPTSVPDSANVFAAKAVGSHIFFKELQGAAWAITDLAIQNPGTTIVLAIDNSALFYVLRRGFTSTTEGRPTIQFISQLLKETGCELLPVLIPGLQNVSDAPSRDEPLDLARTQATWRALYAATYGGSRHLMNFGGKSPRDYLERRLAEEAPREVLDELDAFDFKETDD